MSITRLFLRALAINALTTQEDDPDDITLAGKRVFDSILDPMQFDKSKSDIPAIIVYTDEDDGTLVANAAGHGLLRRMVSLRVELIVGTFDKGGDGFGLVSTDAELEATLDIFEQQVKWALFAWPCRCATQALVRYVVRLHTLSSHIQRDESSNNRLSSRVLMFKLEIPDDCPPLILIDDGKTPIPEPTNFGDEDFTLLPPWLRPMLVAAQRTPSMRTALEVIGDTGKPAVILPLFKRMGVKIGMPNTVEADTTTLGYANSAEGIAARALWSVSPPAPPPPLGYPVTDSQLVVDTTTRID